MKSALLALLAGALIMGGSAQAAKKGPAPKPNKKAQPLICAVTGEKVASVKASAGTSTYKGKTYYFCCAGCKPEFDKNPGFYAGKFKEKLDKAAKESKDKESKDKHSS
jgi:YHS domain-containing protein